MKNVMLSLCIGCAVLMAASRLMADEQTLEGTVSVAQDDDGNVTAVTVTTDDGAVYAVKMDDNGKKLAAESGKKINVTGDVAADGDKKTLTVKSFKAKADE